MCIIMPNNKLKSAWDMYIVLLLIYTAVLVPFYVCFNVERKDKASFIFDLTIDASFLVDIFLTFFQALKEGNFVIVNRCIIAKRYIKGWFFLDLFTTIPFQLLDQGEADLSNNKALRLARIPRLYRLLRIFRLLRLLKVLKIQKQI